MRYLKSIIQVNNLGINAPHFAEGFIPTTLKTLPFNRAFLKRTRSACRRNQSSLTTRMQATIITGGEG